MRDDEWQQAFDAGRAEAEGLVIALMEIELAPAWEAEWRPRGAVVSRIQAIARTALAKYREGR